MTAKLTIESMQMLAAKRNGKCLSRTYQNNRTKLKWGCVHGHEWLALPTNIQKGSWCPKCAGNTKLKISDMQLLAEKKKGLCLSKQYSSSHSKLKWKCHNIEHPVFIMTPSAVKNGGQWCPECANERRGKYQVPDISSIKECAIERGGKCLSEVYLGAHQKLLWECALGHNFKMAPADVRNQNSWCPICKESWGEKLVRDIFEQMFQEKFPKARPSWLKNQKGNRLELDGYSELIDIAFEHHGMQHYKENPHFHKTNKLSTQLLHDRIKRKKCYERGILLIEVPQVGTVMKVDEIEGFIIRSCVEFGCKDKIKRLGITPNWKKIYSPSLLQKHKKASLLVKERGGKILENNLKGGEYILLECAKGHVFEKNLRSLLYSHTWCSDCAGNKKSTISELKRLALSKDGLCLSSEYKNTKSQLQWYCNKHHYTWWSTASNIKSGKWCMYCAGKIKWNISLVKDLAQSRNGQCLSKVYENSKSKLLFKCNKCDHKWKTSLCSLLNGSFCPKCGLEKVLSKTRKTLSEICEIAESRGGKCLSKEYINSHTPLIFKCNVRAHPAWKAAPTNIRRGKWCKLCSYKRNQVN